VPPSDTVKSIVLQNLHFFKLPAHAPIKVTVNSFRSLFDTVAFRNRQPTVDDVIVENIIFYNNIKRKINFVSID
jgi:hypothetical protein